MNPLPKLNLTPQAPRNFYFLEYFYILLKGLSLYSNEEKIFESFLQLKHQYRLGTSKYKKLTEEAVDSNESLNKVVKYKITFNQVVSEAIDYNLVIQNDSGLFLTEKGNDAIQKYEKGNDIEFNCYLFRLMEEKKQQPFRYIIETSYKVNTKKSGLLIFPIYSANRLEIQRDSLKKAKDLREYLDTLQSRLEEDISKHLGKKEDLSGQNRILIDRLISENFLPSDENQEFDHNKYNGILRRIRDFWLKYFLKNLYSFNISLNAFEIWAYRAKQIGLIHITEFYPDPLLYGKVAYPLSVIKEFSSSSDFQEFYEYNDGMKLYLHQPLLNDDNQDEFVRLLHQAYLDARRLAKTYFVNLLNVKERVCYAMKIPEHLFDRFLSYLYHKKGLKIRISLEVDNRRQPKELSNVDYIRREPVMIDGKPRNIIAIDLEY